MNKIKLYAAGFILAAFALAFIGCNQPTGGGGGYNYTVTFDKNHEETDSRNFSEANPKTKTVSSPATTVGTLPGQPTLHGFTFKEWNTDPDGEGTTFDADTLVTADIEVYAQWDQENEPDFTVELIINGEDDGDEVILSTNSGNDGDTVTVTYTLANTKLNNRLVFSGPEVTTEPVETDGADESGTWDYTITESDASDGTITIYAEFTHTDKELDRIAFAESRLDKTYGDDPFTEALSEEGEGSGAISYSSDDGTVATVNSSTGEVTIVGVGTAVITAEKAPDETYEGTDARYTLHVAALQLTISDSTVTTTKTYDTTTTATVTAVGTLDNVVEGDTVTVTAAATYATADAGTNKTITVVYTISGADASNYIKPVDKEITGFSITKADGASIFAPVVESIGYNSITVEAITAPANGQVVEYAISDSAETTPSTGWQASPSFNGLDQGTEYYVHARSKGNGNYEDGTAVVSLVIKTRTYDPLRATRIDFEADNAGDTYSSTRGGAYPTVKVVADPLNSGQKSLQTDVGGYNQAAIIPVNLPYELQNYETFSFRINMLGGTDITNKSIFVYAANDPARFIQYGFGNPANNSNQFAAYLAGQTEEVNFSTSVYTNKWTYFSIDLNPGVTIQNLKGNIYFAIGFNCQNASFLLDDLIFTLKDSFDLPASIDPKEATFKKDEPADIEVTITPNGNTLKAIKNGTAELTPNTDYAVSGNTVTLKTVYLETLTETTVNLTFIFDKGADSILELEIIPAGGKPMVTKYVFSTDTVTATFTPGSNTGSTATVKPTTNGGVLEVDVKGQNDLVIIPFNLGTTNLTNYTKIKIEIASISGDTNFKELRIFIPNNLGAFVGMGDTSTRIVSQNNAVTNANTWNTHTITLSNTSTAYTGAVNLALGFPNINNNGIIYQIRNIELLP